MGKIIGNPGIANMFMGNANIFFGYFTQKERDRFIYRIAIFASKVVGKFMRKAVMQLRFGQPCLFLQLPNCSRFSIFPRLKFPLGKIPVAREIME